MRQLLSAICALNGIDVTQPFTARWVTVANERNVIECYHPVYGEDIEVKGWKDLADIISHDGEAGWRVEFQTYKMDGEDPEDGSVIDWVVDWVDGEPRLSVSAD